MIRTISFALVLGASLTACATDEDSHQTTIGDDELSGAEATDGEAAKADGIDTFGIFTAQKIGAFECNGQGSCTHVELTRANRSTTQCADNTMAASCSVRYLDFSKLGLTTAQLATVASQLQASAATPEIGAQLLVRGKYVHGTNPLYPNVDWVTFEVSELWTAQMKDGSLDGTFVMTHDNGRRCFEPPCAATTEARVNSTRTMDIDGLDWPEEFDKYVTSPGWLPNRVMTAMTQPDGVIVVGYRTHGTIMHLPTTERSVNQVFLRVK